MRNFLVRLATGFIPRKIDRQNFRNKFLKLNFQEIETIVQNEAFVEDDFKRDENGNVYVLINEDGTRVYNPKIEGLEVSFKGRGHTCKIIGKHNFQKCRIAFTEDNASFIFKPSVHRIFNLSCTLGRNNTLVINDNFSCYGADFRITCALGTWCRIGKDCMFAEKIMLRTGDGHAILNSKTKKVINKGRNVFIGDHTWLGYDVKVFKGSIYGSNNIVGAGSMLTRLYKANNAILAGNPAELKRIGVNWDRQTPDYYRV